MQFTRNYEKNIKQLYRRLDSFPLDKLFNPNYEDDEIESPSTIIPAIDPVSMLPLVDACRAKDCKHIACLNRSSFTNICPLCNGQCDGTVYMDIITQRLINFATRQCHGQQVKSVEVENNFFRILSIEFVKNDASTEEESGWFSDNTRT